MRDSVRARLGTAEADPSLPATPVSTTRLSSNLVHLFDDPVELARAHPDAAPVERRVRPAVDHAGTAVCDFDPVAMAPYARKHVEVALPVPDAVGVVPEVQRSSDGIGRVSTSSPTSPTTALPDSSYASTLAARHAHCSSPALTGRSGHGPMKPVHRSVPPLNDPSSAVGLTLSYTHRKPSGLSGAPVEPMPFSSSRPYSTAGRTPAFMHAWT